MRSVKEPAKRHDELSSNMREPRLMTQEIGRITLQLRWLGEFIQRWDTWEKGRER
jgi:hypothetical protein